MNTNLKPCPLCGERENVVAHIPNKDGKEHVQCLTCGLKLEKALDIGVINCWNNRTNLIKTSYIVYYSQVGHSMYPEDTWDDETHFSNADDLYKFIVDVHRHDAHNYNNFPLSGSCTLSNLIFFKTDYTYINGVCFTAERVVCEKPEFYDEVVNRYTELVKRMNKTLPHLRAAKRKKDVENREKEELARLQEKYK